MDRVLVIKLGALGDFVQALGPFVAIRREHPGAYLVLLTTAPYEALARATGLFDDIWLDPRPRGLDLPAWLGLRQRLRAGHFGRVYDLQTSSRSSFYFRLFWPGPVPQWSGIARGCSHPHDNPDRNSQHTLDRQAEQLNRAGIADVPPPDAGLDGETFKAADGDYLAALGVRPPFALLAPGGSAHRPEKRWPEENFAALASRLWEQGVLPVLLGTAAEKDALAAIINACPSAVDLSGRTGLADLVRLARVARVAVGNDTGPMHLIAVAGCPSLVLFSGASDPALCGPRGDNVTILREPHLADLGVEAVGVALKTLCEP